MHSRFNGLSESYQKYRPHPPAVVIRTILQLAQCPKPDLVLDLGSGSGLSTFVWADHAKKVVGVEPNKEFIETARTTPVKAGTDVSFIQGFSNQTTLPDESVDIVACSSSFHWMEPDSTLREVSRILKKGGIFAAFDYSPPPTFNLQAEAAFLAFEELHRQRKKEKFHGNKKWPRHLHLDRMRASGYFRHVKEFSLHHEYIGSADRLVGLALTSARTGKLLQAGMSEDEIGITALRKTAQELLGDHQYPWFITYNLRVGIK
jgi:SAM-dependent methyltransferase